MTRTDTILRCRGRQQSGAADAREICAEQSSNGHELTRRQVAEGAPAFVRCAGHGARCPWPPGRHVQADSLPINREGRTGGRPEMLILAIQAGLRTLELVVNWLADYPTRARSRTIRMLLVRACSRSNAPSRSLEGRSVDQRLPTCRTSPDASSWRSLLSVFAWLSPTALAIRPVECSPCGSSRSTLFSRSSC
jgi:hypothetical protein